MIGTIHARQITLQHRKRTRLAVLLGALTLTLVTSYGLAYVNALTGRDTLSVTGNAYRDAAISNQTED